MSEIRNNAMNFEAVKVSMQQNKDGLVVEENISSNIFNSPKSEYTKKLISSVV